MPEKAWAYYSSAADDEITIRENHAAYHRYVPYRIIEKDSSYQTSRIWFRPQILIDVTKVNWSTTVLGHHSSMPVYIVRTIELNSFIYVLKFLQTATALGKLGHPDGELNLTRAAAKHHVIQMVSLNFLRRFIYFIR
jgi:L-lactate dehydrogenase (cytochrome)